MDERETRLCSRCKQAKPLAAFSRTRGKYYRSYCRPCDAEYKKEHYAANKAAYARSFKEHRRRVREVLRAAKDKPCTDCGCRYPYYVMDFDHRDGREGGRWSFAGVKWSIERLLAEIAKCDVVCANCHRIRTYQRALARRLECSEDLADGPESSDVGQLQPAGRLERAEDFADWCPLL